MSAPAGLFELTQVGGRVVERLASVAIVAVSNVVVVGHEEKACGVNGAAVGVV